jgi:hypothetical protein
MQSMQISKSNRPHWIRALAILSALLVIIFYIWLISVGLWTRWPATTNYYDQLASAFQHGQLNLEQQPDPRLLQLPNPYDPETRSGIPTPLDVSLYNGKFYLYWGPVPGLVLSIFKPGFPNEIGDIYLVFVILSSIFILEILIILKLRELFFPDIPTWVISLSILVASLAIPYAWMFNNPRVYDVAIGSGQLFFLAGFYLSVTTIGKTTQSAYKLILIGSLWALTIGSRLTQVFLIGFMSLMIFMWFAKPCFQRKAIKDAIPFALALGTPIATCVLLLGWYNWARFSSVFETGFNYQLAGPYLQSFAKEFFLPIYIPQNLYNYLFNPIHIRDIFPFFKSTLGQTAPIFPFYPLPKVYTSDEITGWVYSAPFTFFAVIPIASLIFNARKTKDDSQRLLNWIIVSLFGSFVFALTPLLMFFWLSTRYMMDFFPEVILLSIIGFWQGYRLLAERPLHRMIYSFIGIALALITIIVSNAIGLSSHTARIRAYNPELWNYLINLFDR